MSGRESPINTLSKRCSSDHDWLQYKQVDIAILISKNQVLQILHLKHHAYYYYLTVTQQLTHLIIDHPFSSFLFKYWILFFARIN